MSALSIYFNRVHKYKAMLTQRGLLIFCVSLVLLTSGLLLLDRISHDTYNWILGTIMGYIFRDHAGELRRVTRRTDEPNNGR